MSKIVLCETKPAKTAYTIHKINRSFQSYEELCWLLEHYLIFFLSEGIDRSLKNYLKEYLNLEIKSEDAVQQVKEIINFQNYFTADDGQIDLDSDNNYLYIGTLEAYKGMRKYYGEENVIPFYIYVEPGERLSRAVERERRQENPKYTELCRRFIADEEDFSREKILEVGIDKIYENDKLFECVNNIENDIKKYL